jgi:hypothetical protein
MAGMVAERDGSLSGDRAMGHVRDFMTRLRSASAYAIRGSQIHEPDLQGRPRVGDTWLPIPVATARPEIAGADNSPVGHSGALAVCSTVERPEDQARLLSVAGQES